MTTDAPLLIRPYEATDLPTLESWWDAHGRDRMHPSMIPASGVVVTDDQGPIAAGFLLMIEGCHAAYFHGMVTRPGIRRREAAQALTALIEGLDILMRLTGRTLMLGTVPEGSMTLYARRLGFQVTGQPMNQVARIVEPQ